MFFFEKKNQKTFKSKSKRSRKVYKNSTKLRATRVTHFCALVTNVFIRKRIKTALCYSAYSHFGSNMSIIWSSKLDFSTREKNHLFQLVGTICAKFCREALQKFLPSFFQKASFFLSNFSPINQNLKSWKKFDKNLTNPID